MSAWILMTIVVGIGSLIGGPSDVPRELGGHHSGIHASWSQNNPMETPGDVQDEAGAETSTVEDATTDPGTEDDCEDPGDVSGDTGEGDGSDDPGDAGPDLGEDGNNGHGNDDDGYDGSNPGRKPGSGEDDAGLDSGNDGDNGHGNDDDGFDESNPGKKKSSILRKGRFFRR